MNIVFCLFVYVRTSKFTHRFKVEHRVVECIVYFIDLQYHLAYETLTGRIKELQLVDGTIGSKFLLYIDPEMICRLVAGIDEFVMDHIIVPGSTPSATLAIDIGNGMVSTVLLKS